MKCVWAESWRLIELRHPPGERVGNQRVGSTGKGFWADLDLGSGSGRDESAESRWKESRWKESRREWKRSLPELRIVSRKFPFDSPRNTDPQGGWWWRSGPIRTGFKEIAGGPLCTSLVEEGLEAAAAWGGSRQRPRSRRRQRAEERPLGENYQNSVFPNWATWALVICLSWVGRWAGACE